MAPVCRSSECNLILLTSRVIRYLGIFHCFCANFGPAEVKDVLSNLQDD